MSTALWQEIHLKNWTKPNVKSRLICCYAERHFANICIFICLGIEKQSMKIFLLWLHFFPKTTKCTFNFSSIVVVVILALATRGGDAPVSYDGSHCLSLAGPAVLYLWLIVLPRRVMTPIITYWCTWNTAFTAFAIVKNVILNLPTSVCNCFK